MPIYEMIILCRLGETQALANLIKSLVISVYREGGVVRRFINLGDRISDRSYKSKDGDYHSVVRYFTCEFDANPDSKAVAESVARSSSESLKVFTHKIKDRDYYKHVASKESWKEFEVEKDFSEYKDKMIKLTAKRNIENEIENKKEKNPDSRDKNTTNDDELAEYLEKMKNKLI